MILGQIVAVLGSVRLDSQFGVSNALLSMRFIYRAKAKFNFLRNSAIRSFKLIDKL